METKNNNLNTRKELINLKNDLKIMISSKILQLEDLTSTSEKDKKNEEIAKLVQEWYNVSIKLKDIKK